MIGILLPTLQSARRSAETVKCSAALREIGNCVSMYVNDNKGWMCPAKTISNYVISYTNVASNTTNTQNAQQYWWSFLAKYGSRAKLNTLSTNADEAAAAQATIFWGCPSFGNYFTGATGGFNRQQNGYGFNAFPEYTASYPTPADPPNTLGDNLGGNSASLDGNAVATPTAKTSAPATATNPDWNVITAGRWYKARQYGVQGAERALVADAAFWLLEVQAAPLNGQIPGQKFYEVTTTWYAPIGNGQTLYDFYRHGKFPAPDPAGAAPGVYRSSGGKVGYNVLFVDGHVSTLNDREQGYRAGRLRYPG